MPKYNYWAGSGNPTSYNPLPVGWGNVINGLTQQEYILTFRAKSPTSKTLVIYAGGPGINVNLTPEFKDYEFRFLFSAANFHFYDGAGVPVNIVIEDIKLVEKPLGRATINGADGFLSGKWTFHANAKVIDDETFELNPTATFQGSTLFVEVEPNTMYSWGMYQIEGQYAYAYEYDANKTRIDATTIFTTSSGPFNTIANKTFTTRSNTRFLLLTLLNMNVVQGLVFKRPIMNLGTPVPYEPKRGERMVPPQPVKNLYNPATATVDKYIDYITGNNYSNVAWDATEFIPVIPGESYAISGRNGGMGSSPGTAFYTSDKVFISGTKGVNFTVPVNAAFLRTSIPKGDAGTFQIERGLATSYEPFRVSESRRARKVAAGKNLFNGLYLPGYLTSNVYNEDPTAGSSGQRTSGWMPCKPNTNYVVSGGDRSSWHFRNTAGVINAGSSNEAVTTPSDAAYMRVYYSSNGAHEKVQVEEGTVATPFEFFRLGTRKATKFPKKNLLNPASWVRGRIYDGTFMPTGFRTEGNNVVIINNNASFVSQIVNVEPNTNYAVHHKSNPSHGIYVYTKSGGSLNPVIRTSPVYFNSGSNTEVIIALYKAGALDGIPEAVFVEPQMERNATETDFEPYTLINRPALKGLEFNGINDRLQVNTPLGTLGNKDFEIETVFIYNPLNPGNAPQQSIVSCGDIRFGISATVNKTIGFYTPATGWLSVSTPIDNGKLFKLRAVIKPTKVYVYIDDKLAMEKDYTGVINATPQTMLHIGSYGGAQYLFSGSLRTLKLISEGATVLDLDFTKPQNNIGTKIKGNNGVDATVYGSPVQLNRQARR